MIQFKNTLSAFFSRFNEVEYNSSAHDYAHHLILIYEVVGAKLL